MANEPVVMIECDRNMIVHLLRNWRAHKLQPKGFRLAKRRPELIKGQGGVCPHCSDPDKPLVNDGRGTHIDHKVTVKTFADRVVHGELTFDEAYRQLWEDSNLHALHSGCNYSRNKKTKGADMTVEPSPTI